MVETAVFAFSHKEKEAYFFNQKHDEREISSFLLHKGWSGKWKMENEKWKMENEEWEMRNEEWEMKSEKWRVRNEKLL